MLTLAPHRRLPVYCDCALLGLRDAVDSVCLWVYVHVILVDSPSVVDTPVIVVSGSDLALIRNSV